MKKNKILEVVPSLQFGGVEQFLYNYLSNMKLDDFEVHILTQEPRYKEAEERFLALGVKIHAIPTKRKSLSGYFRGIKRLLRAEKYDIVHCHLSTKSFWVLALAKKARVPVRIYHAHEVKSDRGIKLLRWKVYAMLSRWFATDLAACGEKAAEFCFGKGRKYVFIPNAIKPEKFKFCVKNRKKIRRELGIGDEEILIGNVARFVPEKNHHFLVKIFSQAVKKNDRLRLLLIGDGPLKQEIMTEVIELGLDRKVIFVDFATEPEGYYSAIDMVALTSNSEGFPVSLVEAQCAGLPVLSSDQISSEVKLTRGCSFLSLKETDIWVKKILRTSILTDNREEGYRIIAKSEFNIRDSAERLGEEYRRLKKDNILFVVPTLVGGGAEKTVANLSKYLGQYFNINIVVIEDTDQKYNYSGNLIVLKSQNESNLLHKVISRIRRAKELKKIKKQLRIKCAISFLFQADLLNILSKGREKCIMSIRNKDSVLLKKNKYRIIMKYCLRRCNHIVSISEQVKADLVKNFGVEKSKITTIYNPSLIMEFKDDSSQVKPGVLSKTFTFVNMARLTEQKGQWHLIRAFKKVVEQYPDVKLLILGTGELEDYLRGLIEGLKLNNNIDLLGFVDNPYDYLRRSDAFVFSSLFEGLGNSVLEAMACGLPVISTDCDCGPREIIAPDTNSEFKVKDRYERARYGILCPVFDGVRYEYNDSLTKAEEIYSDAMMVLIKDTSLELHYREKSKERIKFFDIDKITKEWKEVIND